MNVIFQHKVLEEIYIFYYICIVLKIVKTCLKSQIYKPDYIKRQFFGIINQAMNG